MKKPVIRVIKRDAEAATPPEPTAEAILIQQQHDKAEGDRDMASTVKTWITERRENSRAEEVSAKDSRFAWKEDDLPDAS